MKNACAAATAVVLTVFLISGCGQKPQTPAPAGERPASQGQARQAQQGPNSGQPARQALVRADLMGEVASITGDKITLKLIRVPQIPDAQQGQQNPASRPAQQQRQMDFTGETKVLTIPSTAQITTISADENNRGLKGIALRDLKPGDIAQVWYSDKDADKGKEIVVRVNVARLPTK